MRITYYLQNLLYTLRPNLGNRYFSGMVKIYHRYFSTIVDKGMGTIFFDLDTIVAIKDVVIGVDVPIIKTNVLKEASF